MNKESKVIKNNEKAIFFNKKFANRNKKCKFAIRNKKEIIEYN